MLKICKFLVIAFLASLISACGAGNKILVVSREDGSGTRGAFVELSGVLHKNEEGIKIDNTTLSAEITNSTSVMITTVQSNKNAIGYISLGSLNNSVKALKIEGVEPTVKNTLSGDYKIRRPFNLIVKDNTKNPLIQDFISYVLSKEGQEIVLKKGYVPKNTDTSYISKGISGKITLAGSSSVVPVIEVLKESYIKLNPKVAIELQQSDSTTGINTVIEGIADIGLSSRALTDDEIQKDISYVEIALDGIAVIVNKDNQVNDLSLNSLEGIYVGRITSWEEIKN